MSYTYTEQDRSGTISVGGVSQILMPSNGSRSNATIQNISSQDLWVNDTGGTAAVQGAGSYRIAPLCYMNTSTGLAIAIFGTVSLQNFSAVETTATGSPSLALSITDRSSTIGTSAVNVLAVNGNRVGWRIQNNSNGVIWYSETGTASPNGSGSFKIMPWCYAESSPYSVLTGALSIIGSASALKFSAGEW